MSHTSISKGCLWHCLKYSFCLNRWNEIITRTVIPAARKKKHTAACSWLFVTAIEIMLIILKIFHVNLTFRWKSHDAISNLDMTPATAWPENTDSVYSPGMFEAEDRALIIFRNQIIHPEDSFKKVDENPSKFTPVTWYMAANIDINDAHKRFNQKYIATWHWLQSCSTRKLNEKISYFQEKKYQDFKPSSHDELFNIDKTATTTNIQIVPNIEKYPSIWICNRLNQIFIKYPLFI